MSLIKLSNANYFFFTPIYLKIFCLTMVYLFYYCFFFYFVFLFTRNQATKMLYKCENLYICDTYQLFWKNTALSTHICLLGNSVTLCSVSKYLKHESCLCNISDLILSQMAYACLSECIMYLKLLNLKHISISTKETETTEKKFMC